MTIENKQEISKVIIKVLKSRFDSFPTDEAHTRNAPFHKAFLQAFSDKFDNVGTNVEAMISMSSWMHGLNTTLGQTFFESVAHILSNGSKKTCRGEEYKIYASQENIIGEIMTSLKNDEKVPCKTREDNLLLKHANGELVKGTNFTVDCYIEDANNVIAIELKSVRPNSGETRGEKQKILKAKAALRIMYPGKNVSYMFGFPFDPTGTSDTDSNKHRFMESMIEFPKFVDADEILLADELWSFLSGEQNTMSDLLDLIRVIATPAFMDKFSFITNTNNLINEPKKFISILNDWSLVDEIKISNNVLKVLALHSIKTERLLYSSIFSDDGKYNSGRCEKLLAAI